MKLYIDKNHRILSYQIMCLLILLPVVTAICFMVGDMTSRLFATCLSSSIVYILLGPLIMHRLKRRSIATVIELARNRIIATYLFGSKQCIVDLSRPAYFAMFCADVKNNNPEAQDRYITKQFMAISNSYFNYVQTNKSFVDCFDYRQVIVFMWDDRAQFLLDTPGLIDVSPLRNTGSDR